MVKVGQLKQAIHFAEDCGRGVFLGCYVTSNPAVRRRPEAATPLAPLFLAPPRQSRFMMCITRWRFLSNRADVSINKPGNRSAGSLERKLLLRPDYI